MHLARDDGPTGDNDVQVTAFTSGKGQMALRASLGRRGLTLPLRGASGTSNTFVANNQLYRRGVGLHLGECL